MHTRLYNFELRPYGYAHPCTDRNNNNNVVTHRQERPHPDQNHPPSSHTNQVLAAVVMIIVTHDSHGGCVQVDYYRTVLNQLLVYLLVQRFARTHVLKILPRVATAAVFTDSMCCRLLSTLSVKPRNHHNHLSWL